MSMKALNITSSRKRRLLDIGVIELTLPYFLDI